MLRHVILDFAWSEAEFHRDDNWLGPEIEDDDQVKSDIHRAFISLLQNPRAIDKVCRQIVAGE